MDCKLCRENMKAYLYNQLQDKLMLEFGYHITQCPDCRREVEQTVKMNALFNDWKTPELDSAFESRLKERLLKETAPWWIRTRDFFFKI